MPLTWYDGDRLPPEEVRALTGSMKFPGQGSIFIGTKGQMLLPHIAMPVLLPLRDFTGYAMPEHGDARTTTSNSPKRCWGTGKRRRRSIIPAR